MSTDWMPGTREGQLSLAKDWKAVMTPNANAWGIPPAVFMGLDALITAADSALSTAKNETTRTPVATAQCKAAFEALTAKMRDIKKRYFLTPPLTAADYIALGLKPHDSIPTPSGPPTVYVTVETYLIGRHELGIKLVYVTGDPNDKANKGYRVWYMAVGPGEKAPADPKELSGSFLPRGRRT